MHAPSFALAHDEVAVATARSLDGVLIITERRVLVESGDLLTLDVSVGDIRRVELDVEVGRPPTLVIVPRDPDDAPYVLGVPHDQLEAVVRVVFLIGDRLGRLS